MAKRKRIADMGTYHRIWTCRLLRAPKGRPWTKPAKIIDALERQIVKATLSGEEIDAAHIAGLRCLRDFAKGFLNRVTKTGRRSNTGNVYLEYAWTKFVRQGKILDEQDIMAAVNSGDINRWHDSLMGGRKGVVKTEKVTFCTNPDRLRQDIQEAKSRSTTPKVDPYKAIGDQIRAEAEAARQRRAEFAARYKAEQALMQNLKANLKRA